MLVQERRLDPIVSVDAMRRMMPELVLILREKRLKHSRTWSPHNHLTTAMQGLGGR